MSSHDDVVETVYRLLPELDSHLHWDEQAVALRTLKAEMNTRLLEAGEEALRLVAERGQNAILSPEQEIGAEAIVLLTGRPSLKVHDGRLSGIPSAWSVLEAKRVAIEDTLRSVGRIELASFPNISLIGTAFQVAPEVIMTNRHVVEVIAESEATNQWRFRPMLSPRIDYKAETGSEPYELPIIEVIAVHENEATDLALLRISSGDVGHAPAPLPIAANRSVELGADVYVVGHPKFDDTQTPERQDIQRLVFDNTFDVKRVSPGKLIGREDGWISYDSSTLGGYSGSCVLDLESGQVVGLHFGGSYLRANYAVELCNLKNDVLFRNHEVNFVQ